MSRAGIQSASREEYSWGPKYGRLGSQDLLVGKCGGEARRVGRSQDNVLIFDELVRAIVSVVGYSLEQSARGGTVDSEHGIPEPRGDHDRDPDLREHPLRHRWQR